MRYQWIKEHRNTYPATLMCQVLQVSSSGFYDWLNRKPSARQQYRDQIAEAAVKSYYDSYGIYGYRKIWQDLVDKHIACCPETVRRTMKELGLYSRTKRKFVVTTDSNHSLPVAKNILDREFTATSPNQKWLTDITYIRTQEGWLFLAAVLDVFSRKIVGWAMSDKINAQLVKSALEMAIAHRKPAPGLLHHSDRGSQYASEDYQEVLDDLDFVCSMSRKGDCWDNAMMESFFGKLKTEWVYLTEYETREQAKQNLFKYIELFYNCWRRHSTLDYLSPNDFEKAGAAA